MRMSLRWKVTVALVAFGLIPAGIVATFAYASTDDFIEKQNLIIRRAAATIGDRVVSVIQKSPDHLPKPEKDSKDASTTPSFNWTPTDPERDAILAQINETLTHFKLPTAVVYLVNPENRVLVKRKPNGDTEKDVTFPFKYHDAAKKSVFNVSTDPINSTPDEPKEIAGYAPLLVPANKPGTTGHGYMVLASLPAGVRMRLSTRTRR